MTWRDLSAAELEARILQRDLKWEGDLGPELTAAILARQALDGDETAGKVLDVWLGDGDAD